MMKRLVASALIVLAGLPGVASAQEVALRANSEVSEIMGKKKLMYFARIGDLSNCHIYPTKPIEGAEARQVPHPKVTG